MSAAPIIAGLALRDDDRAPLALAALLAEATGAPLALVHAYHLDPLAAGSLPRVDASMRHESLRSLERSAAALRVRHEVSIHAWPSSPAACLQSFADTLGAGWLVIGSSHRGKHGLLHAGSVATRLLHGAPCAVAVAPRGYEPGPMKRLAVAFDGSPESDDAVAAGVAIASLTGATLHAYTVAEPVSARPALITPGWEEVMKAEPRERAAAIAARAHTLIPDELFDGADVLEGPAPDELARVSHDYDALVCGSRGYGAVRALLLGSCTRALLDRAACPILVMPRGPGTRDGAREYAASADEQP